MEILTGFYLAHSPAASNGKLRGPCGAVDYLAKLSSQSVASFRFSAGYKQYWNDDSKTKRFAGRGSRQIPGLNALNNIENNCKCPSRFALPRNTEAAGASITCAANYSRETAGICTDRYVD